MHHSQRRNKERQFESDMVDSYQPRKTYVQREQRQFKVKPQEPELSAFEKLPTGSKILVAIMSRIMTTAQNTQDLMTRFPALRPIYYKMKPTVTLGDKPSFDLLEQYAEQVEDRFKKMQMSLS